jgi:Nucleotidyltransferase domain
MLLDELHAKRDVIQTLSRRFSARQIRVFGSLARREERADSDVDFLVDFPRAYDLFEPVYPAHAPDRPAHPIAQPPGGIDARARTESPYARTRAARSS